MYSNHELEQWVKRASAIVAQRPLNENFPGITFSIKTYSFRMGNGVAIDVTWTNTERSPRSQDVLNILDLEKLELPNNTESMITCYDLGNCGVGLRVFRPLEANVK